MNAETAAERETRIANLAAIGPIGPIGDDPPIRPAPKADSENMVADLADLLTRPQLEFMIRTHKQALARMDAAGRASKPIPYVDLEALARDGIPPLDFLVNGWLVSNDIALVVGPAGCGKTTLCSDLALHLAAGADWCGLKVTRECRVLVIDEEQGVQQSARTLIQLGAPHESLRLLSQAGVRLSTEEGRALLLAAMEDFKPTVVILDSATQVFACSDENSASEVGSRFAFLFELRDRFGCAFLLIHHRSKPATGNGPKRDAIDTPRGSTAYTTQSSTVWVVDRKGREAVTLSQAKRRGCATQDPMRVAYAEDGKRIVLSGQTAVSADTDAAAEAILTHLRYSGSATTAELKAAIPQEGGSAAAHEKALYRALSDLINDSLICKPKKGVYELASGGLFEE
jgi:energy-coupling factor transporter ATP-binding protein EcfA2